jgi:hypothetical protein
MFGKFWMQRFTTKFNNLIMVNWLFFLIFLFVFLFVYFFCCCGKKKPRKRKTWSKKQVKEIHSFTNGKCYYCNTSLGLATTRRGRWEIEHVLPFSKFPNDDSMHNLVAACFRCNRSKGKINALNFCQIKGYQLRCRHIDKNLKMCLLPCFSCSNNWCIRHLLF